MTPIENLKKVKSNSYPYLAVCATGLRIMVQSLLAEIMWAVLEVLVAATVLRTPRSRKEIEASQNEHASTMSSLLLTEYKASMQQ